MVVSRKASGHWTYGEGDRLRTSSKALGTAVVTNMSNCRYVGIYTRYQDFV